MNYDYLLYYLNYVGTILDGYPPIARFTFVMVMLLLLFSILALGRMLIIGYKLNVAEKKKKKTIDHFYDKLFFIIKNSTIYEKEEILRLLEVNLRKFKNWKSDFVTDVLLDVKITLYKTGEFNEINYKNCLEALRLMGFWEKRIRYSSYDKKKEALLVIGEFDNGVNTGILSKSMFHKNKEIRKVARDLYTKLDRYNPFRFMEENFDEEFTQLDKLRLHSTLIKRSNEGRLPNLLRWVHSSKNSKYIVFILKEIGFFKQFEASKNLLTLLDKYENRDIRVQIVETFGALSCLEAVPKLVDRYHLETSVVRDAIIKTMAFLPCQESLDFLLDNYKSTDGLSIKLMIARSIIQHGPEGEQALEKLKIDNQHSKKEIENIVLAQVSNEKNFSIV
ncbi:HEAT repeat domain-containing protein [Sphingobacterium sp. WM]|uniref:HEAT repeat domain-containing protein n=1 Tax=Sphingobacterium sp. WM TaxID=3031802 RepID=UPI00240DE8A7|nr:HEAT repeat domain-containing protein [Sphingobacterium sp. WM]WFB63670.1 HEAT repeat domain-containing protein [Sphingobacterium sp. WM]